MAPMRSWILILFIAIVALLAPESRAQFLKDKVTIGRVEWVELPELKLRMRARIDTGAKTCSLHAEGVEEFQRDGALWVKFKVVDVQGKLVELSRKVESTIRVSNAGGFSGKRYVVREKVKLGSVVREVSVNLNDRTKMEYRFLVGRNFLMGQFTVDVARSHVAGD